ncbi:MAG: alanine--tRNA ligase [Candidatus Thorarchaeota archaeon]|nr:MAG: alanine--tRNA ligase [Candidatus Thorarchaeota archaeon]
MRLEELRQKYLEFFRQQKHAIIASASLIPEHDPTVLFTTAGMHPLVPHLLGQPHPKGKRLADCQKCIRTTDIDSVGDTSHLTFFEMLGNWSLGDYWKKEAITWSYQFLTSKKWLALDPKQLSVTVFAGDPDAPKDDESARIWLSLGVPAERVYFLPKGDNWWGPAGKTGPCGPCTEMFMEVSKIPKCGPDCKPGCSCGHFLEIWNDVFMQYNKMEDGTYEVLRQKNVDTGMGLERTVATLSGAQSVYDTEAFIPLMRRIKELSGKARVEKSNEKLMRIISDHVKAAVMIMADDRRISPSNVEHGYIVRRLLRKAIRCGDELGIPQGFLTDLADVVIGMYKDVYDEVQRNRDFVMLSLDAEERKFRGTLGKALKKFEQTIQETGTITGKDAFVLFTSFGLPLEMTAELASEKGIKIDIDEFRREFEQHRDISRTATEGKFKSGLADHTEEVTKLHTATHLLQAALRKVLGDSVRQNGSNITEERLRFDFTFSRKLTAEELQEVEDLVNDVIRRDLKVTREVMKLDQAMQKGALAFFKDTYGDEVSVYSVGDFSKEVCAGPHVEHTGVLKHFKITKQDSIGAGLMRIRAVLDEA